MKTWKEVSGWLLESEGEELRRLCAGKHVLEIGAWQGRSTCAIAEVAKSVITIEHFLADESIRKYYPNPRSPGDLRADLEHNLQDCGVAQWVTIIEGSWEDHLMPCLGNRWFSGGPDVVFYDADHRWQSLQKFLSTMLSYPGVVCIHDYGKTEPEWDMATRLIDGFNLHTDREVISLVGSLQSTRKIG